MKDIHRLAELGVRLVDSTSGGVSVHPSPESSLVVEVKEGQHLNHVLMELKDSVLVKINESFALGQDSVLVKVNESFPLGHDEILRYQDKMGVPNVDDSWT